MHQQALSDRPQSPARTLCIGSVSFLNAKPLIYGLERNENLRLILDVPSQLLDGLRNRRMDVALLPVIDYQRLDGLRIIPSGGIACDGPTLTVRLFSRLPIPQIRTLACDTASHTSVALARILLAEKYGILPNFTQWPPGHPPPDTHALLLIGDKVVCEEPRGFEHQLDLGAAWKDLTGLPFVFAVWMARKTVDLSNLPQQLDHAKRRGMAHLDEIIALWAIPRGWPPDIARRYLAEYLRYDITDRHLTAIRLFHQLALKHHVIQAPLRDLAL